MNAMLGIAVLSLTLLGPVACKTTESKSASAAPAHIAAPRVRNVQDAAYITEVDRLARQNGVRVQWVNPPEKRIVAND